jgi:hypothetical protein
MSRRSPPPNDDGLPPDELADALGELGWLVPETEEAVARAEAELSATPMPLPPDLQDADAVWRAANRPHPLPLPVDESVGNTLARAAREGGAVTPEIEARMREDRRRAEAELDGGADGDDEER